MTKAKIIILLGFILAFGAGAVTGVLKTRHAMHDGPPLHDLPPTTQPHDPESRLKRELGLNDDQAEKLKQIWSKAMRDGPRGGDPRSSDQRQQLRKERDDAVLSMLTEEQKAQYEKIQQAYAQKVNELSELRGKTFQEAVEKTRQILTEEQRKKYDEILKRRGPGGPGSGMGNGFDGRGPDGRGRGRRPDDRQNARPATTQAGRE